MTPPSTNARAGLLIVLLAGLFTYGLIRVFAIQFASGEAYPAYSSLSSRPDGSKLLYDSLSRTPGVVVSRNFFPLDYLAETQATVFLFALDAEDFATNPKLHLDEVESLAKRGDRVVAALRWKGSKKPEKTEDLDKRWHVKFGFDPEEKHPHRLYFSDAPGWRVIDRSDGKILALDRDFEKGSVVLVSESDDFANDATARLDRLGLVSAAIGPNSRVVFDEGHLGIAESGTVVGLARRFRLGGMALGMAFCAALFIWKNAASFPPSVDAPRSETLAGRTSISGLFTLLRRHIKPDELASICWNEWLTGHRNEVTPARLESAEAVLRDRARQPLEAVREIQTVLHSKGPL